MSQLHKSSQVETAWSYSRSSSCQKSCRSPLYCLCGQKIQEAGTLPNSSQKRLKRNEINFSICDNMSEEIVVLYVRKMKIISTLQSKFIADRFVFPWEDINALLLLTSSLRAVKKEQQILCGVIAKRHWMSLIRVDPNTIHSHLQRQSHLMTDCLG